MVDLNRHRASPCRWDERRARGSTQLLLPRASRYGRTQSRPLTEPTGLPYRAISGRFGASSRVVFACLCCTFSLGATLWVGGRLLVPVEAIGTSKHYTTPWNRISGGPLSSQQSPQPEGVALVSWPRSEGCRRLPQYPVGIGRLIVTSELFHSSAAHRDGALSSMRATPPTVCRLFSSFRKRSARHAAAWDEQP